MATKVCLEISVGVDVHEAALEFWVFSQLNMPGVAASLMGGGDVREEDLDAIDEFGGEIGVQRFVPMTLELCSTEANHG
jgi:hypothetical protein